MELRPDTLTSRLPGQSRLQPSSSTGILASRGIQLTPVNREPHGAGTRLENVANYLLYFQEVTHRLGGEEENSRVPLGWPPTSALPISQAVSASTRIQVESIEYPNWEKSAFGCPRGRDRRLMIQ